MTDDRRGRRENRKRQKRRRQGKEGTGEVTVIDKINNNSSFRLYFRFLFDHPEHRQETAIRLIGEDGDSILYQP